MLDIAAIQGIINDYTPLGETYLFRSNQEAFFMAEQETKLTETIKEYLGKYKESYVFKISDRFTYAVPDIIACIRGRFIALEIKIQETEEEAYKAHKPRFKIQKHVISLICKAGGFGRVVYGKSGWENTKQELNKYLKGGEYGS